MQNKTEHTRRLAAFLTALLLALCALMPALADTVSEPLLLTATADPQDPAPTDGDPLPGGEQPVSGDDADPEGDPQAEGGNTDPEGDPQTEGSEPSPADDPQTGDGDADPADDPQTGDGDTDPADDPQTGKDEPAQPEHGTATTGDFDLPVLVRKQKVQLAIPVTFRAGSESWYTNMLPSGSIVSYSAKRAVTAYSGDVTNALEYLAVSVAQTEAVPFVREKLPGAKVIIDTVTEASARELGLKADGNGGYTDGTNTYAEGDLYNTGFAVFDLVVASSVTAGEYQVPVQITWRSKLYGSGSTVVTLTAMGESGQSGADSGSTGGGGGYVSYYTGSTKQISEAKLIVEKVTSDPEVPTAGDEFDLKIRLHNTSKTDTVQNISLSCESDGDSILPVSGAFSAYIETIAADSSYDLVLPVQAQSDIDDKPVKLYIALEYEDSQLNAHSSTQTAVLSVSQQMRIKLDEPVLPTDGSVVGESTAVTMGVFNLGRTTLYNVTVTAQADDSNVSLGASYYCGNMDSGTGKTAELRFTPTAEGSHTVDLVVTYENNAGDLFTETRSVSFYSENYEEDDWYGDPFIDEPEATPAPSKAQQTMDVLSILPWWLYTAAGCVIVLIIVCIGVRVRHERIRALENDEME